MSNSKLQTTLTISGCLLITFCMGSIHAFSTLIESIELQAGIGRMASSLIYSTGLVSVTIAVFFGHHLYRHFSAFFLMLGATFLPVTGIILTSSETWLGWLLGYGVLFGLASGLGYGFSLHACTIVTAKKNRGLALGAITGSYALGAVTFSIAYPELLGVFTLTIAYTIATILLSSLIALGAILLFFSKVETRFELKQKAPTIQHISFVKLWTTYCFGVFAGLMAIGHAVPIIKTYGGSEVIASSSIILMSLGSGISGLIAGYIADKFGCKKPLAILAAASALSLFLLAAQNGTTLSLILMICIATFYGAFIAIFPTLIASLVGKDDSARIYGKVFTAWGFAGLCAPFLAGWFYEQSQSYTLALLIAGGFALISTVLIFCLPKHN